MRRATRPIEHLLVALALLSGAGLASAEDASTVGRIAERADAVVPLAVGEQIPPVILRDAKGLPVPLDSALGSEHTALIFYRGGW